MLSIDDNRRIDGGIRGLSELLRIKDSEVMHKLVVEENMKRKEGGQAPLTTSNLCSTPIDVTSPSTNNQCVIKRSLDAH
jgi:hypothetical protein